MTKKKVTKSPAKKKIVLIKKTTPAKVVAKKTTVKKSSAKKAAAKKIVAKKPAVKKVAGKKSVTKAVVVKKAIAKKTIPKKAFQKELAIPVKAIPKAKPARSAVAVAKLPKVPMKKEANNNIVANASGNELNAVIKTEDPVNTFDKNEFQKATSKGDPRSKLHLNNISKGSIRPSGKKPLW